MHKTGTGPGPWPSISVLRAMGPGVQSFCAGEKGAALMARHVLPEPKHPGGPQTIPRRGCLPSGESNSHVVANSHVVSLLSDELSQLEACALLLLYFNPFRSVFDHEATKSQNCLCCLYAGPQLIRRVPL